jgi:uncharacterized protein (DUF305 family)
LYAPFIAKSLVSCKTLFGRAETPASLLTNVRSRANIYLQAGYHGAGAAGSTGLIDMIPAQNKAAAVALLVGVAVSACGSTSRAPVRTSPQAAPRSVTTNQSDAAFIAKARADSARYPYTAADVQFMQGMIHHHAQALEMAHMAPSHGASPAILTLCARIINAQNDEIALMSTWLRDRNQEVPAVTGGPMVMNMDGMKHEMLMPGMLTTEQMKALDAARGPAFDRKFLEGMIQHHSGAVVMVDELNNTFGADQDLLVQKLSQDIQVDQTTEIARMRKMLAELVLGTSLP